MTAANSSPPGTDDVPTLLDLLLAESATLERHAAPALLSTPTAADYLIHLTSLDLPALLKEPDRLGQSSTSLDSDLSTLCFREYASFVSAHTASTEMASRFEHLSTSLEALLASTSELEHAVKWFPDRSKKVIRERAELGVVLEHLVKVEELLDVPRLVATCVRAGHWSEALDLASRIRELETRLDQHDESGSPVVKSVRNLVDVALKGLRGRALEGLRDRSLKLIVAVRSIQVLRRMGEAGLGRGLGEPELRFAFLMSRWDCLRSSLEQLQLSSGLAATTTSANVTPRWGIDSPDATLLMIRSQIMQDPNTLAQASEERSRFVKKWAELWRELVGEAVSMYSELFLDGRISSTASSVNNPSPFRSTLATTSSESNGTGQSTENAILALTDSLTPLTSFTAHALHWLLDCLETHLAHVHSVASLSSILTQLSYCAVAFSKWGFDFREHVAPTIIRRVSHVVRTRMLEATDRFEQEFKSKKVANGGRRASSGVDRHDSELDQVERWLVSQTFQRHVLTSPFPPLFDEEAWTSLTSTELPPMTNASAFPPLARFVNGQLASLNELRLLPATSLLSIIQETQRHCLEDSTRVLLDLSKRIQTASTTADNEKGGRKRTATEESYTTNDSDDQVFETTRRELIKAVVACWSRLIIPGLVLGLTRQVYGGGESSEEFTWAKELVRECEVELSRLQGDEAPTVHQ